MDVEATQPEPHVRLEALPRAVHQGIAEVRRRNAVVVAWARTALRAATLAFLLWSVLGPRQLEIERWVLWVNAAHLVLAGLTIALLQRRWHAEAVALVAALLDAWMVFGWGLQATASGQAGTSLALLSASMHLVLLFAVVALPTRFAGLMAAAAVIYQFVLGIRAGVSPGQNVLGTMTAAAFALVAIWTGVRMVRLAAGLAVKEVTAEMAERHAQALDIGALAMQGAARGLERF